MNFRKSYKMVPILIGLSTSYANAATELLFSESDIIKEKYFSIATSTIMGQYELNAGTNELQKFKFEEFYKQWYKNTSFFSNARRIIEDENFQSIIRMGDIAIPLIIEKIDKNPSQLVWALNIINNRQISNAPNINITDACKLWVKFYKKQK